jgi:hypothetical protein
MSDDSDTKENINIQYIDLGNEEDGTSNDGKYSMSNDVISIPKRKGRPRTKPIKEKKTPEEKTEAQRRNMENARRARSVKTLAKYQQIEKEMREFTESKIILQNLNIQLEVEKKVEKLFEQKRLQKIKENQDKKIKEGPIYKNTWIDKNGFEWKF